MQLPKKRKKTSLDEEMARIMSQEIQDQIDAEFINRLRAMTHLHDLDAHNTNP